MKSYGVKQQSVVQSDFHRNLEEFKILGFSIIENVLDESELAEIRNRLDELYKMQEEEFGKEKLKAIKEANLVRCLLGYDDYFLALANHPVITPYLKEVLGDYYILNLQNGIINMPNEEHHQSSWHRDLPYQDFTISRPIAMNAFFCIDPFSELTGSTYLLPYSHRLESIPSETYVKQNQLSVTANPGSVIIFDSMLYHRAGYNSSDIVRRGINQVYTVPILKQQIDIPAILNGKHSNTPEYAKLLGYTSQAPSSVIGWREIRLKKLNA